MNDQYKCSVCGKSTIVDHINPPDRPCGCINGSVIGSMQALFKGRILNPSFIFVEKANLFYGFSCISYDLKSPSSHSLSWHFIFIALELRLKTLFLENGTKIEEIQDNKDKKYGHEVANMFSCCVEMNYLVKNDSVYKILTKYNHEYKSNGRNYRYYLGIQDIFTHSKDSLKELKTLQNYYSDIFLS